MNTFQKTLLALSGLAFVTPASAAIMHAFSAVSVPVDSPWALGALGALVAVVVARVLRKR